MDHKHREDLEQNDLVEFGFRFREWFTKYGSSVLWIVLAVAAVALAVRWYSISQAQKQQEAWNDLASATDPDSYRAIAREYGIPEVTALAYLRGGDLELNRATLPQPEAATQPATTKPAGSVEEARQMYLEVMKLDHVAPVYHLNAMLGLAAVAEAQKDWDAATSWYKKVGEQAGDLTSIKAQAEARASRIESLQQTMPFAPEATTQPTTQSTTQPSSNSETRPTTPAATEPG